MLTTVIALVQVVSDVVTTNVIVGEAVKVVSVVRLTVLEVVVRRSETGVAVGFVVSIKVLRHFRGKEVVLKIAFVCNVPPVFDLVVHSAKHDSKLGIQWRILG